jgi:hypothetical protein
MKVVLQSGTSKDAIIIQWTVDMFGMLSPQAAQMEAPSFIGIWG